MSTTSLDTSNVALIYRITTMTRWMLLFTLLSAALIIPGSQLLGCPFLDDNDSDQAKYRKQSGLNLEQLLLGMHNYESDYKMLPAHAIYDKEGKKPLLSWRVAILPFLKPHRDMDDLYKRFKLDEPWDSENNKVLLKEMPKVFEVPGVKSKSGMTHYQVFTMPVRVPEGKKIKYMPIFPYAKSKVTLGYLSAWDGPSNTICITEATTPVEWTKPSDLVLEHDDAELPKLGIRPYSDEFLVIFADGAVKEIKNKIDDMNKHTRLMKQLIGRKDGMKEDVSPIVK